jgi:16S rRNA (uracil1498-N3)-methyltransferase
MKQFLLPPDYSGQDEVTLGGKDSHYLTRVLRLKEGASLTGMDRSGNHYELIVKACLRDKVVLSSALKSMVARPDPFFTLYQCLPKMKKMDLIVRQATEAGISEVVPMTSEFTVPVMETGRDIAVKVDRWQRIVREAVQQSGNAFVPEVREPISISDLNKVSGEKELFLFFHHEKVARASLHEHLEADFSHIRFLIGAEGGLSGKEVGFLLEKEFKPVYLGENVLRVETAALYALACIKIILLEKQFWRLR